ncbi:MAG: hypothetical protein K9K66_04345 [Desulfarculaceae bacterium]|nr:hypothetical protein [Desulfarculaceae bacterium]MCF8073273.1 hypothetical protein [Desulfarculaceae bacterium]MCF8100869.1 hypothetical protein [Desulfarculaceae bacterium]MCF8116675.1 hypothetical protein [Desulfarculaceae bacterium]
MSEFRPIPGTSYRVSREGVVMNRRGQTLTPRKGGKAVYLNHQGECTWEPIADLVEQAWAGVPEEEQEAAPERLDMEALEARVARAEAVVFKPPDVMAKVNSEVKQLQAELAALG